VLCTRSSHEHSDAGRYLRSLWLGVVATLLLALPWVARWCVCWPMLCCVGQGLSCKRSAPASDVVRVLHMREGGVRIRCVRAVAHVGRTYGRRASARHSARISCTHAQRRCARWSRSRACSIGIACCAQNVLYAHRCTAKHQRNYAQERGRCRCEQDWQTHTES
jgi:hypothetical protein